MLPPHPPVLREDATPRIHEPPNSWYEWTRDRDSAQCGGSVLIVLDDWAVVLDRFIASGYTKGLPTNRVVLQELFAFTSHFDSFSGSAFFDLPVKKDTVLWSESSPFKEMREWIEKVKPQKIYVLTDVFQEGLDDTYDAEIGGAVYSSLIAEGSALLGVPAEAIKIGFLSQGGIGDLPGGVQDAPLFKRRDEADAFTATALPTRAMLDWLGLSSPLIREWALEEWKVFRRTARRICASLGEEARVGHPNWVHHLPSGGEHYPEQGADSRMVIDMLDKLKRSLVSEGYWLASRTPDCSWPEAGVLYRGWDFPPFRALSQFDSFGFANLEGDLSHVLRQAKDAATDDRVEVSLEFRSTADHPRHERLVNALRHDYLWLNAPALATGLLELARGFSGELGKHGQTGKVVWSVMETCGGKDPSIETRPELISLAITVKQQPVDSKGSSGTKYMLPSVTQARRSAKSTSSLKRAIRYMENSGSGIISKDGAWVLQFGAELGRIENGPEEYRLFWMPAKT